MSALLTPELFELAVENVLPAIMGMMESGKAKRKALSIVAERPGEVGLYHYYSIGDPQTWENPYEEFARSKCQLSKMHSMDTHALQQLRPHLFDPNDIKYGGGVYFEGLAVGVSGVQWQYDEMFARWVAAAIVSECKLAMVAVLADRTRDRL